MPVLNVKINLIYVYIAILTGIITYQLYSILIKYAFIEGL